MLDPSVIVVGYTQTIIKSIKTCDAINAMLAEGGYQARAYSSRFTAPVGFTDGFAEVVLIGDLDAIDHVTVQCRNILHDFCIVGTDEE